MKEINIPNDALIYVEKLNFIHYQLLFTINYIVQDNELCQFLPQYEQEYMQNYLELELVKQELFMLLYGKMPNNYNINFSTNMLEVYDED